jgi:hemoglobin
LNVNDADNPKETLYAHAGGDEGLHRLEEIFYEKALADRFSASFSLTGWRPMSMTWFTAESFGGPARFTEALGFGYLIDVHRNLAAITNEQRERFVTAYLESLDEAGLPDDEPFRRAVREHVEFGAEVAQQNPAAQTDDQLHPIREVPRWNWAD